MIREVKFESQDRRMKQILAALKENGISSIEEANEICEKAGLDPYKTCEETQMICFENAKWAYVVGTAIALKKAAKTPPTLPKPSASDCRVSAFPARWPTTAKWDSDTAIWRHAWLREETQCFAFLAGHESFAAAEGAIKIAEMANKVRKNPLRCILNGLGKDAAMIISRINGFTYADRVRLLHRRTESGERDRLQRWAARQSEMLRCRRCARRRGNSLERECRCVDYGQLYQPDAFSAPSGWHLQKRAHFGRQTLLQRSIGRRLAGRTLHPDNMAAGPASYGMTDTMGRMHSDAQFAGSSSVPAHVEMMGFLGIGNNPMVGCTVACAVNVALALSK